MSSDLVPIYEQLFEHCRARNFAGHDPFDGLNSRLFRRLPLKRLAPARLVWLQLVKRAPFDLRPLLGVPEGVNPKGLALFALAELARFRTDGEERHAADVRRLLGRLSEHAVPLPDAAGGAGKTAFGYNFDWQSRAFFAPRGTPTIVPTAFAAQAYAGAFECFGEEEYGRRVAEIARFVVEDLNRPVDDETGVCFSYTPLDRSVIYNASLLAAETLALAGTLGGPGEYLELAGRAARFVVGRQGEDGSWAYGPKLRHAWVDNFHTAYILLSLHRLGRLVPGLKDLTGEPVRRGLEFWLANFFLADGAPKYYDKRVHPIDIHSAAAAVAALSELDELDPRCLPLAQKVAAWTVRHMRDEEGFFYYQKRRSRTVRTSFIRWNDAWMAYALAGLLEARGKP